MMRAAITDHAVIRYLERVKGIDIASIRREMHTDALDAAVMLGAHTVKLGNGCRMQLVGQTVVTVKPKPLVKKCKVGRDG